MKFKKIIKRLTEATNTYDIVRMYMKEEGNYYYYYYIHAVNDMFVLGQEEDDFTLNGYHIRLTDDIKKVEIKDDLCPKINEWNGIVNQLAMPAVDISSWNTIFKDLTKLKGFVVVEDENAGEYIIGRIKKVCKKKILMDWFDANGIWQDESREIAYSSITHVAWDTRYTNGWYEYMKANHCEEEGKLDGE